MNAKGDVVKRLWAGVRARNDARFLNAFGFDVPPCQIILQHPNESLFWIVDLLRAGMGSGGDQRNWTNSWCGLKTGAHPKIRSGCAMKSVMRSNMLRGSSTNVGKVTLDRSIPTLEKKPMVVNESQMAKGATDLSWDIREETIDPSFSSLKSA